MKIVNENLTPFGIENWLRLVEKELATRASLGRDKIFGAVRVGFGLPCMHFVPTD
jgi:hypothetical protein